MRLPASTCPLRSDTPTQFRGESHLQEGLRLRSWQPAALELIVQAMKEIEKKRTAMERTEPTGGACHLQLPQ
jgi:hypothetical protein